MRRFVFSLAFLAASAASAYAQEKPYSALSDDEKAQRSVADQVDRQYKATVRSTRKDTGERRVDPRSNLRNADNSKPKH